MSTTKERSARWRERKREGLIAITIDVSRAHRRAFERMGLIDAGFDRDQASLRWAVERYLDTAPAVQGIGDALYRDAQDFADVTVDATVSPHNTV